MNGRRLTLIEVLACIVIAVTLSAIILVNVLPSKNYITEEHQITSIENGYVRTEQTDGSGEGTYYIAKYYARDRVTPEVGDIVEFAWLKQDYENEDWEYVHYIKEVK